MGNTWEVWSWVCDGVGGWRDVLVYSGESWLKCICIATRTKRGRKKAGGRGCVTIKWR